MRKISEISKLRCGFFSLFFFCAILISACSSSGDPSADGDDVDPDGDRETTGDTDPDPDGDVSETDGDKVDMDIIDKPDGDVTDGDVIDGDGTDGDITDGDIPDGDIPDGDLPDGDLPDGDLPDGDLPDGDIPDGDLPDGDLPDGDLPDGDLPDGDLPDGDIPDGDLPDGDLADGDFDGEEVCNGHGKLVHDVCLCDLGYTNPPESFLECVSISDGDVDGDDEDLDRETVLLDCCQPNPDSAGCLDQEIQNCVCDVYDWCCTTRWNEYCVNLVNFIPCGYCSSGDEDGDVEDELEQTECGAVDTLTCSDEKISSNFTGQSFFDSYPGCGFVSSQWEAPEVIYSFTSPKDCTNTIELISVNGNLDLFIIDPCDSSACYGYGVDFDSTELQQFVSAAGQEYQIVVDGRYGALSQFSIEITCDCGEPEADGDEEEEFDMEVEEDIEADIEEDAERDEEDPDLPPLCSIPIPVIQCGDSIAGNTSTQESHWSGYDSCGEGQEEWTGGDMVYSLLVPHPARTGQVTIDLTAPAGDLDLFLLDFVSSNCLTGLCLAERTTVGSTESLSFEYSDSPLAFIVVDGRLGAGSAFILSVECDVMPADGDEEEDVDFEFGFDLDILPPDGDLDMDPPPDGDQEEEEEGSPCSTLTVGCGDTVSSVDSSSQSLWQAYPGNPIECGGGNSDWTGPEWVYRFVGRETCVLQVDLEAGTDNLDLFLLASLPECDQGLCLGDSVEPDGMESMSFAVSAGEEYYVVVESRQIPNGDFNISFSCNCGADGDLDTDQEEAPTYEGECCLANGSPGCEDPILTACVCAQDPWCCEVEWNEVCVKEVDRFACGSCWSGDEEVDEEEELDPDPEEEADPIIYEGNCCLANGSPACEDQSVADCVCSGKPGCCSDDWSMTCVDLVNSLGCGDCGDIDGDLDDDPDLDPDPEFELPEFTDIELPTTDCCQPHDSPLCSDNAINICVCEVNIECCAVEWSQMCVELVESLGCGDCSPPDGDMDESDQELPPPFICPGDTGNEIGVGLACTTGGGECPVGLTCLLDVAPNQPDICVLGECTTDEECGTGATCRPAGDSSMCLPNHCLSSSCEGGPGNEIGVGLTCTDGGGECPGGTVCAVETNYGFPRICTVLDCTTSLECGTEASCIDTEGTMMCIPSSCIGLVCAGDAGNEVGVGKACTAGGGECPEGTVCILDLDPDSTLPMCLIFDCTDDPMCGADASCIEGGGSMICLPDRCLGLACEGGVGNELGVGRTCSIGGGECTEANLTCALDVDPLAPPLCVILNCTVDGECGSGAVCAEVEPDFFVCLPEDCFGKKRGGYHETQDTSQSYRMDWTFAGMYRRLVDLLFLW